MTPSTHLATPTPARGRYPSSIAGTMKSLGGKYVKTTKGLPVHCCTVRYAPKDGSERTYRTIARTYEEAIENLRRAYHVDAALSVRRGRRIY